MPFGLEVLKNRAVRARNWWEEGPMYQPVQSRMEGKNWPDHGQIQSLGNTGSAGEGRE